MKKQSKDEYEMQQPPFQEIQELRSLARKTKDVRMKTRYDAVRMHCEGRKKQEIADILGITYQTVRNYIRSYDEEGVRGLEMTKPPGRDTKLTKEQESELYNCISTKLPKDVGFAPFVNWTSPLACKWVFKEFGIKFSERGLRNVFERLKLSYTRPTYTLNKADPEKQETFKKEFEEVKKTNFRRNRLYLF